MFSCIQMYFPCTRSSTCGTRCCWVTPPSPSVLAWPYCSSSGTDSWLMASTSASCFSRTCQVRKWTSVYVHEGHSFCHLFSTCVQPQGQVILKYLFSCPYCTVIKACPRASASDITGDCSLALRLKIFTLYMQILSELMISSKLAALHSPLDEHFICPADILLHRLSCVPL